MSQSLGRYLGLLLLVLLVGCRQTPQPVRHFSDTTPVDTAMLRQLEFNAHMAEAADRECIDYIRLDTLTYAQDSLGFWYTPLVSTDGDGIRSGQRVEMHIHMAEFQGHMCMDVLDWFTIGSDHLPQAVYAMAKMMHIGERMRLVAPWYTMYGTDGIPQVKAYTNLIVDIECIQIDTNDRQDNEE